MDTEDSSPTASPISVSSVAMMYPLTQLQSAIQQYKTAVAECCDVLATVTDAQVVGEARKLLRHNRDQLRFLREDRTAYHNYLRTVLPVLDPPTRRCA